MLLYTNKWRNSSTTCVICFVLSIIWDESISLLVVIKRGTFPLRIVLPALTIVVIFLYIPTHDKH